MRVLCRYTARCTCILIYMYLYFNTMLSDKQVSELGKKVLECVDEVIVGSDARPDNLYSSLILETEAHHNYLLANSVLFSWYPEYFLTFYSLNEMIFCITHVFYLLFKEVCFIIFDRIVRICSDSMYMYVYTLNSCYL